MSAEDAFAAIRSYKRELTGEGLSQEDVDALNAIFAKWEPTETKNPFALSDGAAFFASVRSAFGTLTQGQVDGFQTLLQAFGVARWPLSWAAYGLATAWHETNKTMEPVREAYWVKNAEAWRKANLRYYPHYGRGFVQLTWPKNYATADEELGLGGELVKDPDLALQPGIAAKVMRCGMEQGWFTGKSLKDYLPLAGKAGFDAYTAARRIINGQDKATEIAKEAQAFEAALEMGAWA